MKPNVVQRYAKLFSGAGAAILLLAAASSGAATIGPLNVQLPFIWADDFESASVIDWTISGNAPVITSEFAREGSYALKSVLDYNTSIVRYRTEVAAGKAPDPVYGQDYWYGFSIYLPDSYVPDDVWEIVAQWHDRPDVGEGDRNPILSFTTTDGLWAIASRWDDTPITAGGPGAWVYKGTHKYQLGKYATGKWTDWVVHAKWSYINDSSKGLLQVWKDGVKVVDQVGPNCYNDDRGPYFKMGMYKGWKSSHGLVTKRVLYHDALRFAAGSEATYNDVAPRSAVAQPKPPAQVIVQ